MTELDVDYVLVIFGGVIGYSGDDINKFLWMVRIAEGEHPQDIKESDYFTERGEFRVDSEGSPTLLNCLMYKLSYLEEAYTSEHWLVRVYRVKKPDEFNRPRIDPSDREIVRKKSFVSKKNSKRKRGLIKSRPVVVKGQRS